MTIRPPVKMTPQEMADFMRGIEERCYAADGRPAETLLRISVDEARQIATVARFLLTVAPHREAILKIVTGRR